MIWWYWQVDKTVVSHGGLTKLVGDNLAQFDRGEPEKEEILTALRIDNNIDIIDGNGNGDGKY